MYVKHFFLHFLNLDGFPQTFKATVHKAYCLILVSLTILHWSLAALMTVLVLPILLIAAPFRTGSILRSIAFCLITVLIAAMTYSISTGEWELPVDRAILSQFFSQLLSLSDSRYFPQAFLKFLQDWTNGKVVLGKSPSQHVFESVCHNGLALPGIVGFVIPAIVLGIEICSAKGHGNSPTPTNSPVLNSFKSQRRIIAVVAALGIAVYHVVTQ